MEEKRIKDSHVTLSQVMMPQDANLSGNVHGGVVMKHIDEAAGMVAIRHARSNCVTASIDRLDFHHPVFVGNLLTLKASINMVPCAFHNNVGLDEWKRSVEKGETIRLTSIFGGTSIY